MYTKDNQVAFILRGYSLRPNSSLLNQNLEKTSDLCINVITGMCIAPNSLPLAETIQLPPCESWSDSPDRRPSRQVVHPVISDLQLSLLMLEAFEEIEKLMRELLASLLADRIFPCPRSSRNGSLSLELTVDISKPSTKSSNYHHRHT